MNKAKINELYEQAHVVYEIPYEASVVEPGNIAIHKQKVWDRYLFAELIVRECLTFVEPMPGSGDIDDLALEAAYNQIKEHFGVEE